MLVALTLLAAVTTATPVPALALPEPVTRNARLLQALNQTEDDFATVQKELGLVGSAPLAGLKSDRATARPSTSQSAKPHVQKASAQKSR
jgi:hypothetical protein